MNSASEVQSLAMKLPRRSRIKLACDLLHSAAPITTPPEILHEAARRETEIETGMIKPLSESAFWSGVARRRNRS
ncbi:MAG: hypothetical protein NTV46_21925 [Verrucomicrobia bacterium]|nr:hypothetical protein [Verrucomicrobiota bacterium]